MAKIATKTAKKVAKKPAPRRLRKDPMPTTSESPVQSRCDLCYEEGYNAGRLSTSNNLTQLNELKRAGRELGRRLDEILVELNKLDASARANDTKIAAVRLLLNAEVNA